MNRRLTKIHDAPPGTLRLVCNPAFPPFSVWRNGRVEGLVVDMLRAALAVSGVGCELVPLGLEAMAAAVADGRGHGWACLARTPEREREMTFSRPFATTAAGLFVRRQRSTDEASPGRIATPAAGPLIPLVRRRFPAARIKAVRDYGGALAAVRAGVADAAALNWHVTCSLLPDWPGIVPLTGAACFGHIPLAAAFPAGRGAAGLACLDRGLDALQRDGRLKALRMRWLEMEVVDREPAGS